MEEETFWLYVIGAGLFLFLVLCNSIMFYAVSHDSKELTFKIAQVNQHALVIHSLNEHICS